MKALESNFGENVYSRKNFAVWLSLYAEMQFNEALRARQGELAREYVETLAAHLKTIAQHRSLPLEAQTLASNFVAFLDGLWLQWCLSESNDASAEKASAYAFLEQHVGSLREHDEVDR